MGISSFNLGKTGPNYFRVFCRCLGKKFPRVARLTAFVMGFPWIFKLPLTFTILIVTFKEVGTPVMTGLDPSWIFGINYFFENSIQLGSHVVFTYGPLGFLSRPVPIGNNFEIALVFWVVVQFVFIWMLLTLAGSYHRDSSLSLKLSSVLIILALVSSLNLGFLPIFFVFAAMFLYAYENKTLYFIFSVFFATLVFLIKVGTGTICFLIVGSVFFLARNNLRSNLKLIPIGALTLAVTFLSAWGILYGNLNGIFQFLWSSKELSSGYSSAMTIATPFKSWLILLAVGNYILCAFLWKNPFAKMVHLSLALPILAWFKYSFGRGDPGHVLQFLYLLLYLSIFLSLFLKRRRDLIPYGVFFIVSWVVFLGVYKSATNYRDLPDHLMVKNIFSSSLKFNGYPHFKSALSYSKRKGHLNRLSGINTKKDLLTPPVLKHVGNSPVDVYPWEQTIIYANNLNWEPRKIIQSYVAFTPWLDHLNSGSISAITSPKHLLWHSAGFGSIDGRYLLNDEPETIYQIFKNFELKMVHQGIAVLDKTEKPLLGKPKDLFSSRHSWDQWIDVPADNGEIIRGRISIQRTLLGRVKRLVFKEDPFYIVYRFENGDERKFRLVPDTAINGVWMNPLVRSIREDNEFQCSQTTEQENWIGSDHILAALDSIKSGENSLKVSGWVYDKEHPEHTQNTEKLLLLKNFADQTLYLCGLGTNPRPGVSRHFNFYKGEITNAGYKAVLDTSAMPEGKYFLGFILRHKGISRVKHTGFQYLKNNQWDNLNLWHNRLNVKKVKQIKLSHSPNDFIEDRIDINWEAISTLEINELAKKFD